MLHQMERNGRDRRIKDKMSEIILTLIQIIAIGILGLVIFVIAIFWLYFIAILFEEIRNKWSGS